MCSNVSHNLNYEDFIKIVDKSDFEKTIKQEHDQILSWPVNGTFTEARRLNNLTLNRYINPTCFDHSRVNLPVEKKRGNYINANYLDGYDQAKKFICMEAPMHHTMYDLWRTVWMHHSRIIVMLCERTIFNQEKDNAYWPHLEGFLKIEKFTVQTKNIEVRPNYVKTTLEVSDGTEAKQEVLHFMFTTWPNSDLPASTQDFLDFILTVRRHHEEIKAKLTLDNVKLPVPPIVVHSKRGIGRTGAFCALDIEISRFNKTGIISLASTVSRIRNQSEGKEFQCDYGSCIPVENKCDGQIHCADGSDETHFHCKNNVCPADLFRCAYGACVRGEAICDGIVDCADYSDELLLEYRGKFESGEQIPASMFCGGVEDCTDRTDCTDCTGCTECAGCTECTGCTDDYDERLSCGEQRCAPSQFQCANGHCVSGDAKCDDNGVHDCVDGSDETDHLCNRNSTSPNSPNHPSSKFCVLPEFPEHGAYIAGWPDARPGLSFGGISLTVSCEPPYRLDGSAVPHCLNGKWDPPVPECKQFCQLTPDPSVTYYCGEKVCSEYEPSGTEVYPQCNTHYFYTEDLKHMNCEFSSWDYIAKCEPMAKDNYTSPDYLKIKGDDNNFNMSINDNVYMYVSGSDFKVQLLNASAIPFYASKSVETVSLPNSDDDADNKTVAGSDLVNVTANSESKPLTNAILEVVQIDVKPDSDTPSNSNTNTTNIVLVGEDIATPITSASISNTSDIAIPNYSSLTVEATSKATTTLMPMIKESVANPQIHNESTKMANKEVRRKSTEFHWQHVIPRNY